MMKTGRCPHCGFRVGYTDDISGVKCSCCGTTHTGASLHFAEMEFLQSPGVELLLRAGPKVGIDRRQDIEQAVGQNPNLFEAWISLADCHLDEGTSNGGPGMLAKVRQITQIEADRLRCAQVCWDNAVLVIPNKFLGPKRLAYELVQILESEAPRRSPTAHKKLTTYLEKILELLPKRLPPGTLRLGDQLWRQAERMYSSILKETLEEEGTVDPHLVKEYHRALALFKVHNDKLLDCLWSPIAHLSDSRALTDAFMESRTRFNRALAETRMPENLDKRIPERRLIRQLGQRQPTLGDLLSGLFSRREYGERAGVWRKRIPECFMDGQLAPDAKTETVFYGLLHEALKENSVSWSLDTEPFENEIRKFGKQQIPCNCESEISERLIRLLEDAIPAAKKEYGISEDGTHYCANAIEIGYLGKNRAERVGASGNADLGNIPDAPAEAVRETVIQKETVVRIEPSGHGSGSSSSATQCARAQNPEPVLQKPVYKDVSTTVACKHCGAPTAVKVPHVKTPGSQVGGVTNASTGACRKCHKMSSYNYDIRDGQFTRLW